MGKIAQLDGPSLEFAHRAFGKYFEAARIEPPPELERREFAAFPFAAETVMRRHAALPTAEAMRSFLVDLAPRHVYYSSAYYEEPGHATMASKGWRGADLIFDLDADHLKGAGSLDYAGQLALVKEQLKRLYDDFLLRDFGLDPSEARIVFSGGRGYHVHVRDERFRPLNSPERRELVDYIQGGGIDAASAIWEERPKEEDGRRRRSFLQLSRPDAPGWKGRTTRAVLALLARWEASGAEVAEADLTKAGVPPKDAKRLARQLVRDGAAQKIRATLRLDVLRTPIPLELLKTVLNAAAIEVQGETDAPVTTDIHRLIRLPGSLHGGTGFRVVPVERDRLDAFDPFTDAVYPLGRAERVPVTLRVDVDHPLDPPVAGRAGKPLDLPTPAALFLILRGEAALRPGPAG